MAKLVFTFREVTAALERKLGLDFGSGRERNAWYWEDDRKLFRVTIPKTHHGEIRKQTLKSIVNQLKLTNDQFGDLVHCPMSEGDYEALIHGKKEAGLV